eukprot:TRINITY_DN46596_c0_g1_i1.p1 TRINITY_DN46596_c0_g1~~TRINITY_DN46596_c0_g1_i1.p1  ORF type:complete len:228 (-),score=30.30 TRINITY_DN46596_c0_g1_i1:99-782(-)
MHSKKISLCQSSTCLEAPKWSIKGRNAGVDKGELVPGPGKYGCPSLKLKYQAPKNVSFGSSVRANDKKWSGQPGPGAYDPYDPNQSSAMYGFGSASRLPVKKRSETPDPGAYSTAPGLASRQMTFGGRREGKKTSSSPGPGQYTNIKKGFLATTSSDPQWNFGSGQRSNITGNGTDAPGPGTYPVAMELGKTQPNVPSCPNFSLYSRRRPVKADTTPGPIFPHYSQF